MVWASSQTRILSRFVITYQNIKLSVVSKAVHVYMYARMFGSVSTCGVCQQTVGLKLGHVSVPMNFVLSYITLQ